MGSPAPRGPQRDTPGRGRLLLVLPRCLTSQISHRAIRHRGISSGAKGWYCVRRAAAWIIVATLKEMVSEKGKWFGAVIRFCSAYLGCTPHFRVPALLLGNGVILNFTCGFRFAEMYRNVEFAVMASLCSPRECWFPYEFKFISLAWVTFEPFAPSFSSSEICREKLGKNKKIVIQRNFENCPFLRDVPDVLVFRAAAGAYLSFASVLVSFPPFSGFLCT